MARANRLRSPAAVSDDWPIATVPGNVTVSFDVLSYAGRLLISVVYDPDHMPDHALLADALACELTGLSGPE